MAIMSEDPDVAVGSVTATLPAGDSYIPSLMTTRPLLVALPIRGDAEFSSRIGSVIGSYGRDAADCGRAGRPEPDA